MSAAELKDVMNVKDAKTFLKERFRRQLELSDQLKIAPNQSIEGDAAARKLFWLLLAPPEQREFFISFIKTPRNLPRIRPLFGSPPYSFLEAYDAYILHAPAINKTRSRMAYKNAACTESMLFQAHYIDQKHRKIRIIEPERRGNKDALVFDTLMPRTRVVADMKVEFIVSEIKSKKIDSIAKFVSFPQVNDTLLLMRNQLLAHNREQKQTAVRANVVLVRLQSHKSVVSRLVLDIL